MPHMIQTPLFCLLFFIYLFTLSVVARNRVRGYHHLPLLRLSAVTCFRLVYFISTDPSFYSSSSSPSSLSSSYTFFYSYPEILPLFSSNTHLPCPLAGLATPATSSTLLRTSYSIIQPPTSSHMQSQIPRTTLLSVRRVAAW